MLPLQLRVLLLHCRKFSCSLRQLLLLQSQLLLLQCRQVSCASSLVPGYH
jgi:hypothetical protein